MMLKLCQSVKALHLYSVISGSVFVGELGDRR